MIRHGKNPEADEAAAKPAGWAMASPSVAIGVIRRRHSAERVGVEGVICVYMQISKVSVRRALRFAG